MTATPEMIAAAWATWHSRHGGKLGPGTAFVEAINAALAFQSAADTPPPSTHMGGRWRIFEAATGPGYWGIELEDAGNDDDAIMSPIKVHRDTVARIVEAHNAALAATATEDGR